MESFELLADAETPPFQIDEDEPVGEELRLRYRYLDLRKERMRVTLQLRHDVIRAIREHLSAEGFLEVETPSLPAPRPRARATTSFRAGSSAAPGTRCRSRRSSSSSS